VRGSVGFDGIGFLAAEEGGAVGLVQLQRLGSVLVLRCS
jgi:hypothetical protein